MKRKRAVLIIGTAVFAVAAWAQAPGSEDRFYKYVGPAPGMPAPPPLAHFAQTFEYIQTDGFSSGKVVKGSPYTADETSETIQTLADGNRIVRKTSSRLYRDKDGRTRSERSFSDFGPNAANADAHKIILINDAVAGVTYRLEPDSHVAVKSPAINLQTQMVEKKIAEAKASGGNLRIVRTTPDAASGAKTESLGKQTIEGVEAEGTRNTTTIPAGQIGNEQPIEIVSERWFSPDLQTFVLTKRNDPMAGETVYKLSDITRADPDPSLFQVPAGYTVKDGPAKMEGFGNVRFIKKEQ